MFLNAGDIFDHDEVLKNIFDDNELINNADLIYGDTNIIYNGNIERYNKAGDIKNTYYGMQFSHQSMIVKSKLQINLLYNTKYKYAADYDFILNLFSIGKEFVKYDGAITKVISGGISDTERIKVLYEWIKIIRKKSLYGSFFILMKILFEFIKYPVKALLKFI